jgi:elongation factor G
MKNIPTENVRNFAVTGHGGCGKTSLIENLIYTCGANSRLGKVDNASSLCDYQDDEKRRKVTINSKLISLEHDGYSFSILDTPGYADFYCDTISSIRVSDCVLIVIDATAGIQVGTIKVWRECEKSNKPRAIYINKIDKDLADFSAIRAAITESFGSRCLPVHIPIGHGNSFAEIIDIISGTNAEKADDEARALIADSKTAIFDAIAETDDSLLEKYLAGEELSKEEVAHGLQAGIANGTIIPILCGSAEKSIGIHTLLEDICHYFPAPSDLGEVSGKNGVEKRAPQKDAPFSAFVFKTVTDPFIGHLTFFRVYSGTVTPNCEIFNTSKNAKEKLGHLYAMRGKEQIEITEASAGDIVVVPKLKQASINDTFCDPHHIIEFAPIAFPSSTLSFSIHPKEKGDEEKIATGLHKLCDDDPTLSLIKNVETKEMVLSGLGDLHISVMLERLKERYKVEVTIGKPKVAYKETIRKKAKGHEKHKKQSGGRGQYGEVYLEIEPLPHGEGFQFVDKIVGGAIPRNYLPAIEKGIIDKMKDGILAGYPVVDVRAIACDGSFHAVDSSELAFKIAGSKAFKDAFLQASPVLLEPIMNIEVTAPDDMTGAIMGDLNGKRARVQGMDAAPGGLQIIKAEIPAAELFTYSNELRSMTGGRGSFTLDFSHYEEVPMHLAQKVIDEARKEKETMAMAH